MSPIVIRKGVGSQGVKLLLNGRANPESDVAYGHCIPLKPFVSNLLVCYLTHCRENFSRGSGYSSDMGSKTQGHKEHLHRSGPKSIVRAIKDRDKEGSIVRHCDLEIESFAASLASV